MRLSAIPMDDCNYRAAHLRDVADYLFDVMAEAGGDDLDQRRLGELTVELADKLDGAPHTASLLLNMRTVAAAPGGPPLLDTLRASLSAALDAKCNEAACVGPCKVACTQTPTQLMIAGPADAKACGALDADQGKRQSAYDLGVGANPGKCAAGDLACLRTHLLLDFGFYASDISCAGSAGAAGKDRKKLRQFSYLVWDAADFEAYMRAYLPDPARPSGITQEADRAIDDFRAFVHAAGSASANELGYFPQQEIASAIRTIGLLLQARAKDPVGLNRWVGQLHGATISAMLNSLALYWRNRGEWSAPIVALRDSLKDLLTLPRFALVAVLLKVRATTNARGLEDAVASGVQSIVALANSPQNYSATLTALSNVFRSNADVVAQLEGLNPALKPRLESLQKVLLLCQGLLVRGRNHDWVGISLTAIDLVPETARKGSLGNSLAFTRTLMSMYQAKTRDEAKAIFEAKLEDESSREKRFDGWAVDIAGHVAGRGGWQWNHFRDEKPDGAKDRTGLFGLYAPVGLQFAYKYIGLLAYPVDVGSYLVIKGDQSSEPDLRVWDALRQGGFAYLRPWASVPVVFGGGVDYRPAINRKAETRLFAAVSMELPLFMIY